MSKRPEPAPGAAQEEKRAYSEWSQSITVAQHTESGMVVRASSWRRIKRRVREMEEPSTGWLAAAWTFIGIGVAALVAVLTLPNAAHVVDPWVEGTLWAITGASAVVAGVCFLADKAVNKGRKTQREDIVDEMELCEPDFQDLP